MATISGDDDFSEIGRGDLQNGMGEGVYLGEVGFCSGGGEGE